MIPAWARVGAKVVYVRRELEPLIIPDSQELIIGHVYTVSDVYIGDRTGLPCLSVIEERQEWGWTVRSFKPAVPARTQSEDVAQFLSLLDSIDA